MRSRLLSTFGISVAAIAVAALALFRTAEPTNRSEFERLAKYDVKDGKSEAEADLAHGRPRWITFGGPAFDVGPSTSMLSRRLGLQRDHIAYCMVPDGAKRYASEYNRVIFDHLTPRYGREFVLDEFRAAEISMPIETEANQAPEPTPMSVTSPAAQEPRRP
jgi:hypothetical protein